MKILLPIAAIILLPLAGLVAGPSAHSTVDDARAQLLKLHRDSLQAHFDGNWQWFGAHQADDYVMAYDGEWQRPSREETLAMFRHYFSVTTFTTYEDIDEPIVHVSDDGTLGTVLVHVRVVGVSNAGTEDESAIDATWTWINTWRKTDDGWRLASNVSNMHEGAPAAG